MSLVEIQEKLSIVDLLECHMALDVWDELERRAHEQANEKR